MNGVGSTSFFGYEGLRIIISGLIGVGLIWAVASTLAGTGFLDELTISVILGLVVGLTLYFLQLPDRSPSSREPDPVALFARAMGLRPDAYETANKYYVAFDTSLPPGLRERSQYYLQIYRIGFEVVLLGTVATQAVWFLYPYQHGVDHPVPPVVFLGAVAILALITLVPLHDAVRSEARSSRRGRKPVFAHGVRSVVRSAARELGLGSALGVVLVLLVVLGGTLLEGVPAVKDATAVYLLLFWLRLHLFGLPSQGRPSLLRRPLVALVQFHSRHAATVPARYAAYALLTVGGLARITDFDLGYSPGSAFLLPQSLGLWIAGALVLAGVIAARGHEVRFAATNHQQGTWFKDNTERVRQLSAAREPGPTATPSPAE